MQAADVERLQQTPGPFQDRAHVVWQEWFASLQGPASAADVPDVGDWLQLPAFFTELRRRPELQKRL